MNSTVCKLLNFTLTALALLSQFVWQMFNYKFPDPSFKTTHPVCQKVQFSYSNEKEQHFVSSGKKVIDFKSIEKWQVNRLLSLNVK